MRPDGDAAPVSGPATSSMEDYLERIHQAIEEYGYARAVDIAATLAVKQSSVTKMFQRLDEAGYAVYEKYRGLVLTREGDRLARSVRRRHRILQRFMDVLELEPEVAFKDVEGIEHHVSRATVDAILDLVEFIERHPELVEEFRRWRQAQRAARPLNEPAAPVEGEAPGRRRPERPLPP